MRTATDLTRATPRLCSVTAPTSLPPLARELVRVGVGFQGSRVRGRCLVPMFLDSRWSFVVDAVESGDPAVERGDDFGSYSCVGSVVERLQGERTRVLDRHLDVDRNARFVD